MPLLSLVNKELSKLQHLARHVTQKTNSLVKKMRQGTNTPRVFKNGNVKLVDTNLPLIEATNFESFNFQHSMIQS